MTIKYLDSKRFSGISNNNLVAHLKFNDDVTDSKGSNNGTVTGTTTYVTGKVGKAFSLNGSSYITLANESNFDFERTDPFSIAFWVNMGNNTNKMLMCKGDDPYSVGTTSGISIWTQADWFDVNINASGSQYIRVRTAIASIEDSTWHHVTVTYDGSSTASGLTVYYDGVSQSLATISDTLTSSSILNDYPFLIGDSGAGSRDWTGLLDDLRIYSKELDQIEINTIYNSGNGTEVSTERDLLANVQDNSIYIETDTAYRYWFNGTAWFPTFQDNFHSDGWTPVGGFTGVSGGVLTGDLIRNSTNHGAGRAITALDNSAWVMRFKLVINTKATSENNSVVMGISQTGVTGINDPRYGLGVGLSQYHDKFRLVYPANQTWYQAVVSTAGSDPVPDAGTYYIELKRTLSTSVTLNIFPNPDYTGAIATVTQTISSSINALDNLDVQGQNDSGSGGTWNISIDDLKIYDGVTSI